MGEFTRELVDADDAEDEEEPDEEEERAGDELDGSRMVETTTRMPGTPVMALRV